MHGVHVDLVQFPAARQAFRVINSRFFPMQYKVLRSSPGSARLSFCTKKGLCMLIPSPPMFLPKQRYAGRFWDTDDVMELLSIYYGARRAIYPVTWQYRTLISIQRAQDATNAYRKGYGPDWKSLKKKEVGGVVHWVPDNGFAIKATCSSMAGRGESPSKRSN